MDPFQAGQMRFNEAVSNSNRYNRQNPDASNFQKNANAFANGLLVVPKAAHDSKIVSRTGRALGKAGVPFAKEVGDIAGIFGFGQTGGRSRRIKV